MQTEKNACKQKKTHANRKKHMQIEKNHQRIRKHLHQFYNSRASQYSQHNQIRKRAAITETRCKSSQQNQIQKRAANRTEHNGNVSGEPNK